MPKIPDTPPSETPPDTTPDPQIAHQTDGRLRLRLASWPALTQADIERRLRRVDGVLDVRANPLTRGILLRFEPSATSAEHLLAAVRVLALPAFGDAIPADTASVPLGAHATVTVERPHEAQAADGLPACETSPTAARSAPSAPALPVYLTPLADVMAWANEAIAQPHSLNAEPVAPHVSPAQPSRHSTSYLRRLLDVFRRLDTAGLALKAVSALAGVACAASPLALVLSLVEIAQLLVDLHLRAIA